MRTCRSSFQMMTSVELSKREARLVGLIDQALDDHRVPRFTESGFVQRSFHVTGTDESAMDWLLQAISEFPLWLWNLSQEGSGPPSPHKGWHVHAWGNLQNPNWFCTDSGGRSRVCRQKFGGWFMLSSRALSSLTWSITLWMF